MSPDEPDDGPRRPDPSDLPDGIEPDELRLPMTSRKRRPPAEGELEVFGIDEQTTHPVELERWVDLARAVLHDCGVRGDAELSLLFVDQLAMAELNERFMEKSGPTDVLAFPIDETGPIGRWPDAGSTGPDRADPDGDDAPLLLGDVVLCPAVAALQAPEHDSTVDDELALLVVHGVLHVLGYDHAEEDEATRMKRRERELLDEFHHPR